MKPARIRAYLALATCYFIWGAAQPIVKPALTHISPLQYMGLRYLIALPVALIIFIVLYRRHRPTPGDLLKIIGLETIVVLNLLLLYTGLKYTTALQSSLILNARPVFITFMGILFLREREEAHEWWGLVLSLTGISMVVLSPQLNHATGHLPPQALLGNLLIIGTNVVATFSTFFIKKVYRKLSKPLISSVNVLFGTLLFITLNLATSGPLPLESLAIPSVLFAVMYMAFFGTMLATSLELYGYNLIEASEASLFQYLEPLVYVPLAILWLKEPISPFQLIGLVTILAGVILAAIRLPHRHHRKTVSQGQALSKDIRLAQSPIITHYQRFR